MRYGYLDFSTAERRRTACEAELALNRRAAPDLYRDVRSVNRQRDGTIGFGPGEPVDWLVVMRRFPAGALLADVAARGGLDLALCQRLADRVAAFHQRIEPVPCRDGAGRIARVIDGNRDAMAALRPGALPDADSAALDARSRARLADVAALLDRRGREGQVRHGHGDLHLGNICLWQGEPTLFDCLEFDTALATTDLLYDLAFLLMDLWHRGHRAQAAAVFNRYCDRLGEAEGLAALPLFLSLRAGVRAHVAGLDEGTWASARAYLAAALDFLEPPPPRLIAIGGLSGTGKSTVAAGLAPGIGGAPGARVLRSDVIRKRLAGLAPEQPLPRDAYTPGANVATYDRLLRDAAATLAAGHSVIADAVFARPEERAAVARLAEEAGLAFDGFWLEAPAATLMERVGARTGDASDADAAVVERQLGYALGTLTPWTRVEAGGTADETLTHVQALVT